MISLSSSVPPKAGIKALLPKLAFLLALALLVPAKADDPVAAQGNVLANAYNHWAELRNTARPKGTYDVREVDAFKAVEREWVQFQKLTENEYRKAGLM